MKALWIYVAGAAFALALSSFPAVAQAPTPKAPIPPTAPQPTAPRATARPVEIKTKAAPAAPAEKPAPKKSKSEREKKKKKEEKSTSGFDPKSFLLKLVMNADDDGDGALSTEEFRQVPLLKELKKDRVDSLFADIDTDSNASLDAEEVGKGFGKITSLAKDSRSLLDDEDAAKQAKKLKQLAK